MFECGVQADSPTGSAKYSSQSENSQYSDGKLDRSLSLTLRSSISLVDPKRENSEASDFRLPVIAGKTAYEVTRDPRQRTSTF